MDGHGGRGTEKVELTYSFSANCKMNKYVIQINMQTREAKIAVPFQ